MKVEFVRFKATDEVELQGWFTDAAGDMAVIHLHGKSGNGYENYFLDNLRDMYSAIGISLFSIDTRGRGVVSDFRQGNSTKHAGSCFEIFDESIHDIQGAIDYLKSIGKKRFVLQGHSLGCTKAVNYILNHVGSSVDKLILLAPTDMSRWAASHPEHNELQNKAKMLISEGKPEELVDAQCWVDKEPLSAQTYLSICEAGSPADIYGDREGGALLGRVNIPTLIVYGTEDIGITKVYGTFEDWLSRINGMKSKNTEVAEINGAGHGFRGYEYLLSDQINGFIS